MIIMKCENCGRNEANVKYTQFINGEKKQMFLCEECSKKLGISDVHFNMPISFNSFLEDFFDDMNDIGFLPALGGSKDKKIQCSKCGLTWDDFLHTGSLGCSNCYEEFESRIDPILRSMQGATLHIGRLGEVIEGNEIQVKSEEKKELKEEKDKIEELKNELKQSIKEERYEDAAKLRDEIKKLEEEE